MKKPNQAGSQSGIALFMVISALGLLSVLLAELTYSTQMNARLAYNYIDNLKAYYLVKAGFKLSLVRLKAYTHVKKQIGAHKEIKEILGPGIVDKVWSEVIVFPIKIPKEANMAETDAIKEFQKETKLPGTFTANITSEGSRLNLNNLLIKELSPQPSPAPSPGTSTQTVTPNPQPTATPVPINFKEVLLPAFNNIIESKKTADREFSDVYRNVTGQDLLDAVESYMKQTDHGSNLPGYKQIKPKLAPLYSLSELHMIPGIDDELYQLLQDSFTVYSTPGININTMNKQTLMAIIPEMTAEDADKVLAKRDDKDVGKPWALESEFWDTVKSEAPSAFSSVDKVKERLQKAGLMLITDEESFKISVLGVVGLATRRLEAHVILGKPKDKTQAAAPGNPTTGSTSAPGAIPQNPDAPTTPQEQASANKAAGVNLIYWRML